jgi:hypothetical protein
LFPLPHSITNLGQSIYLAKHANDIQPIANNAAVYGWIAIITAVAFIVIIGTVYYGIIYFLFLRKLQQNMKELKEMK